MKSDKMASSSGGTCLIVWCALAAVAFFSNLRLSFSQSVPRYKYGESLAAGLGAGLIGRHGENRRANTRHVQARWQDPAPLPASGGGGISRMPPRVRSGQRGFGG